MKTTNRTYSHHTTNIQITSLRCDLVFTMWFIYANTNAYIVTHEIKAEIKYFSNSSLKIINYLLCRFISQLQSNAVLNCTISTPIYIPFSAQLKKMFFFLMLYFTQDVFNCILVWVLWDLYHKIKKVILLCRAKFEPISACHMKTNSLLDKKKRKSKILCMIKTLSI